MPYDSDASCCDRSSGGSSALLLDGRFILGVGSGEALNEHILGDRWPAPDVRLSMLEEAVSVMRELWEGGLVTHRGEHYTVEGARIYSCPHEPPAVYVSGFGPKAVELAARIGDGYVNVSPSPEPLQSYRENGGKGPAVAGLKVCWDQDEAAARKLAHDVWRTTGVPGQLNQELTMPKHFEEAAELVTEEMVVEKIPCGPDPERHVDVIRQYLDAGYEKIYISQIGDDQAGFLSFLFGEVMPRLSV